MLQKEFINLYVQHQKAKIDVANSIGVLAVFILLTCIGISFYWLLFGTGYATLFPFQHNVLFGLYPSLPGHSEAVEGIIREQGYMSFYQSISAGKLLEAFKMDSLNPEERELALSIIVGNLKMALGFRHKESHSSSKRSCGTRGSGRIVKQGILSVS